jgi:putative redox protein
VAKTLEAVVEQVGASTSKASVRTHEILVDRPVEKGGANRGAMGGELLLVSLGGCFMSNMLAAIAARGADISNVAVKVVGTVGGVPERYEAIDMRVSARYGDADQMRKLVAISERACLVTNTLKNAIVIDVDIDPSL